MPLTHSVDAAMHALHSSDKRVAAEFITDAGYEVGRLEKLLTESQENEMRALRSLERVLGDGVVPLEKLLNSGSVSAPPDKEF